MATTKARCEGKRRQFRKGAYGVFKCMRKATGTVTTKVGFTKTHPCCGDDECYSSIAAGYPADWKEYAEVKVTSNGGKIDS